MAEVTIQTKIDAADAAQTIQELRKSLKDLVSAQGQVAAGSAEWKKLSKAINDTEGRIGDLTDSFNTLKGSGVERVNASFGLFREGLRSFDFEKIKIGLNGIGSAMRAIPVLLIAEGVIKLVENFDKLKNSGGLLGKAFTAIGDAIGWVGDKLNEFADYLEIIDLDLEKVTEQLDKNAQKINGFLDAQTRGYDAQIKVLQAQGKETIDLELKKQATIIGTNKLIIQQLEQAQAAGATLTEDQKKRLEEARRAIQDAQVEGQVIKAKQAQDDKKAAQERAALAQKEKEEELKRRLDLEKEISEAKIGGAQISQDLAKMIQAEQDAERKAQMDAEQAAFDAEYEMLVKNEEKKKAEKEKSLQDDILRAQRREQIEANYFNAVGSLAETFFQLQIDAAEGNEEKQNELRKRAFQVDKALKASQATIDGIKSVNATLAQGGALAVPLAISVGVLAFANVAKILAQKFDDKAGGGSTSTPRTGGVNIPNTNTPTPNTNQVQQIQQGTVIKERPIIVKVSEINDVQDRVARVEEQAVF